MERASGRLRGLPERRWYSSMLSSTWAGLPRSVMNTGPFEEAFLARLVSRLNSRLDRVVIATLASNNDVEMLIHGFTVAGAMRKVGGAKGVQAG